MKTVSLGWFAAAIASFSLMLPVLTSCRRADKAGMVIIVTDRARQPVNDAIVTVVNQRTNSSVGARPAQAGEYRTPALHTGSYTVVVQKEGFKPEVKANVQADESATVRVGMQLSRDPATSRAPAASNLQRTANSVSNVSLSQEDNRSLSKEMHGRHA